MSQEAMVQVGQFVTSMGAISHFGVQELWCHHCQQWHVEQELIDQLDSLRVALNLPITIISGFRCAAHNQDVGGAASSRHTRRGLTLCQAADIKVVGISFWELSLQAIRFFPRVILEPLTPLLHVDVDSSMGRANLWVKVTGQGGQTLSLTQYLKQDQDLWQRLVQKFGTSA